MYNYSKIIEKQIHENTFKKNAIDSMLNEVVVEVENLL